MNSRVNSHTLLVLAFCCAFAIAAIAVDAWAQDATVTTVQHGPSSYDTTVQNAEIVYAEGNNLVLRSDEGKIEHLVVPDEDKFHVNGREVSVYELKPGTKLTETLVTTTTPKYVNSVRTIEGTVWHVQAPHTLVLTLPDNQHVAYDVPKHAKFSIDGQEKTVFDLRKGMKVQATIVTDEPQSVVEYSKTVTGKAPPTPETPTQVGTLLIMKFEQVPQQ